MVPSTVGGAEPLRKSSMSQPAFAPNASLPRAGTEVEDDYNLRVPHVSDYGREKGGADGGKRGAVWSFRMPC
jgi:hypothetical protein